MPVRKHENKKNVPAEIRDSAIIPTKDEARPKPIAKGSQKTTNKRINSLSTVGKKKKAK